MSSVGVFLFDPRVGRFLIADEGEVIVDEVHKHWAVLIGPSLEMVAAVPVVLLAFWAPSGAVWVPLLLGFALAFHGLWRILQALMDRFVITNMRVFRVHGILSQSIATMPIARILDISVHMPIIGRVFGYGHFVFESAAQEQGLREIRFVGKPNERGLTIQRVIQRSGLRGPVQPREPVAPVEPVELLPEPSTEPPVHEPLLDTPFDSVIEAVPQSANRVVRPPKWPWGDPPRQSERSWETAPVPPADPDDGAS